VTVNSPTCSDLNVAPPMSILRIANRPMARAPTTNAPMATAPKATPSIVVEALERTQPMLPLGLGYVEGVTHDYRRHGTTTLFAALDTANGKVLTQCRPRHRHQEYLGFLREIEKNVPKNLEVHVIVDNYATHKHLRVKRWFAARPRFHVHFTPTYASWLNQVEIWFNRITQQAIRRGTFSSVKDLVEKIDHYVKNSNRHAQPFVWTATADSIFTKVERLCERIYGTAH
jgi:putative transposase